MRENYTSFSSFEHAKTGHAKLGSGSSPGDRLVLKRTRKRASLGNVFLLQDFLMPEQRNGVNRKVTAKRAFSIVALMFIMLCALPALAQTTVTVGSGTGTSTYIPMYPYYGYSYSQSIYQASELTTAGVSGGQQINKIRYRMNSSPGANSNGWTVYLGNTSQTSFSSNTNWIASGNLTQVFSGNVTFPANGSWMEITLSSPFMYTGGNLVVAVDENTAGYGSSGNAWSGYASSTTNSGIYFYSDGTNPNPASPPSATARTNTLPQMQFEVLPSTAPACDVPGSPLSFSAGTITASTIATTIGAPSTAPTGYLVVRSSSSTLSSAPVTNRNYAIGDALGGGTVCYNGTSAAFTDNTLRSNTGYYYTVFSYNKDASYTTCIGPVYSTSSASLNATTCATVAVASAASNVKNSFATLNWVSLKGANGKPVTYTAELYSDSGLSTLVGTYTVVDQISYDVTDLVANTTYYYRVKAEVPTGCGNAGYSATVSFKAENNYSPISVTGFNADVIAEGNGWATTSTNNDIDGGGYVYMSRDYLPNSTSTALTNGALPVNRTMASPNNAGLNFLMPDYKQNNAVRLTAAASTQDLVLTTPTKLTNIYLAVTSGGAVSSITGTIYFTDGSTQAIGSTSIPDWFSPPTTALPALAYNIGRVNKNGTTYEAEFTSTTGINQSNAKIFQVSIDILAANQAKKVSKITINRVASGSGVPNIFAVSGKIIGDCPTLTSASAVAASSTTATVNWVLGNQGDGGVPTYTVQTYSDSGYTTLVSTNSSLTGTSFTVPGLNPATQYYFRVTATNSACSSNIVNATATTLQSECVTPGTPTFTAATTTSTGVTGTIGAPTPSAVGYVVVRSISSSLGAAPANFTTYTVGTAIGSGNVVYVGTSTAFNDTTGASNTHYYYYIYAYNSGTSCSGPIYSASAATTDVTTCVKQALVSGASNIRNSSATINWTSVTGGGASAVTYNLEVYTDNTYTTLFTSFTALTAIKQSLEGLTANATYYYRVQAAASGTCSSSYSTGSFTATNGYTPIDVTSGGYNQDVIANGTGAAQGSTTAPVDATGAGNAYVSRDYVSGAGVATTVGLPINRFLASSVAATSGLNFIIPDYNANNSLRLAGQNDTGTLTFETPVKLTDLYIATTGGSGALTASAEIIFSDGGATQLASTVAIPDWVTGTGSVIVDNLGRANMMNTTGNVEIIASKIFQVAIPISVANQTRKVSAVKFTKTSGGATEPVLNIFAISGKIIGDCPTLTSASAVASGSTSATVSWVLANQGDGGVPTYTVQTYSDSGYTTLVSTNSSLTGTSFTVPDLNPATQYYFRVTATNSACSSNIVNATATTLQSECVTPGTPSFTATTTTSTGVTGTIGAPTPSAVGYVVVRSISSSLGAAPANFTTYTVGTAIGSGNVVYVGTSTAFNDTTGASNTRYYYYIYAYNSGTSCSGPIYSASAATTDVTTCVKQALVSGASNIRNSSATINWTSVTGGGASAVTYNLEVYTDNAYTTLFTSFTGLTAIKQSLEGLTANATYYYRVQAAASGTCSSSYSTGSFTATNGYTPIDVTSGGYNQDVIANGTGAAQGSTTAPVDATTAGNAYVSRDYVSGAGVATTVGLPVNRFLASSVAATSGLNFIIPDYNANNSLRLAGQNDTGTLTFETPVKLTDLYIATTGGSGALTASAEIIFSDGGATQLASTVAIPDWVTGTGSVIVDNLGRANMMNTTGGVETIASKIFQVAIPIDVANQTRKVSAVKFTKTSTGATQPVLNIFAISGKIIGDCPTMASTSVTSVNTNDAAIAWVLGNEGEGGTPTYTVDVFTDATFTTTAVAPVTGLTGTSYAIVGLNEQTTYYYRVKATNAACDSGYVTGTFTTSQIPATLDWTEDFEGTVNWALVNGTQTNKWVVGTATASTGTKSLYVSSDNGATNGYNITATSTVQAYRDIAIPAGTTIVDFSFDWKSYGEGPAYDFFRVWMVPTSYIPTAGTQIASGNGNVQISGNFNLQTGYTTFTNPILDVSSFAGQSVRLVFEWTNDFSTGTNPSASIDNVKMELPTCLFPANPTAVAVTTSATLSWTVPSIVPGIGYEYIYSTTNTAPTMATAGTSVSGTSVNVNGLTANTRYYWWVRSVCSETDKSAWSAANIFFTGACAPTYTNCDATHRITLVTVPSVSFTDNLSGTTACSAAAINRTSLQIPVNTGESYTFNVTSIGWMSIGMAVDYNNDGNFDDANELIALPNFINSDSAIYTVTANIPSSISTGNYKLRIWNRLANAGNGTPEGSACGSYAYGTYVEYTLAVTAPCFTWTGAVSNSWTATGNWCAGLVPTTDSDVIITPTSNNPVITSGTAYTHNLTISEGATLTVATGATLDVENILSVHELGTLTVQDNGALIQGVSTATNVNSGNIVFHKKGSSLYRLDYTLWSSPVTGQDLAQFSPATSANRFYEYKPATDVYGGVTAAGTSFETAKGYLIRMPNTDSAEGYNTGVNPIQFDGTFTGQPGNGTITKALSTQGNLYNAVGNPYPSPINLHDFLFANSTVIDGASGVYLWRKKNDGASSSYATLTLAAFTANPATGGGSNNNEFYEFDESTGSDNWLLAPGQGFLVKGLTGTTNPELTFTNEMRRGTPGSSQSFFRQAANRASRLWLNLHAVTNGATAQAAIAYMDQATLALDYGYDAKKFAEPNTVALYSIAESTPLTIQARPAFTDEDVVPMGFVAPVAGSFTISIDHVNGGFSNGQTIYIKDNALGVVSSLNEGSYTFATEAGTFNNRFEILYNNRALGTDNPVLDANTVAVFKQGKTIQINTGSVTMNGVTIYDTRGRIVYSMDNVNNTQTAITNLAAEQQVLIVEVATVKGKVSKRIVF